MIIAYREKYDFSFAYLHYPYSPFDLAVFEHEGKVVAKPIFDLHKPPYSPFFSFKGKVYKIDQFETRDDAMPTELISEWIDDRVLHKPFSIDLEMKTNERDLFKMMLERKKVRLEVQIEEINEWLLEK